MKVYFVVAVLFNAGDQVPVILFKEVVGKGARVAPEQIGATVLNKGVIEVLTTMVVFTLVAHCPASGVKVYSVVAKLFIAGAQLPIIPLAEVVGNAGMELPVQ